MEPGKWYWKTVQTPSGQPEGVDYVWVASKAPGGKYEVLLSRRRGARSPTKGVKKRLTPAEARQFKAFRSFSEVPADVRNAIETRHLDPKKPLRDQPGKGFFNRSALVRKAHSFRPGSKERRLLLRLAQEQLELPFDEEEAPQKGKPQKGKPKTDWGEAERLMRPGRERPSEKWLQFWEEKYDRGRKRVPNPNPETRGRYPQVAASTAWRNNPGFQEKVRREYQAWKESEEDEMIPYEEHRLWLRGVFLWSDQSFAPQNIRFQALGSLREKLQQEKDVSRDELDKAAAEVLWALPRADELGLHKSPLERLLETLEQVYQKSLDTEIPNPPEKQPSTLVIEEEEKEKDVLTSSQYNPIKLPFAGASSILPDQYPSVKALSQLLSQGEKVQKYHLDEAYTELVWAKRKEDQLRLPESRKRQFGKMLSALEKMYKIGGMEIPDVPEKAPPGLSPPGSDDWMSSYSSSGPVLGFRLPANRHKDKIVELKERDEEGIREVLGLHDDTDLRSVLIDLCGAGMVHGPYEIIVHYDEWSDEIRLKGFGPGVYFKRIITADRAGNLSMINSALRVKQQRRGVGLCLILGQVTAAHALGVEKIQCEALCFPPTWVGCKVWPKLGYDGEYKGYLPEEMEEQLEKRGFWPPYAVSEIRALPGGEEWWEKHGKSFDATLDLESGSAGLSVLKAYIRKKKALLG